MIQPDQENRTKSDLAETIRIAAMQWISLGSQSYQLFMHKDMDVFSGNATFYILMAMVPFFTLAVGLINFLPENFLIGFGDMLVSLFPNIPQIQSMMQELVNQVNPQKGTLVVSISLLIMIWSASNGVSALQLGLMRISENKQTVRDYLSNELPIVKLVECDATYLLWLDCSALKVPSKVLSEFLRTNQGLFLSAGIDFGKNGDNFLRMNVACPPKLLKEGLGKLKAGITALTIINKSW